MPSGRRRPIAGSGATCWLAEVRCNALQWRMRRRWRRSRGGGGRAGGAGDDWLYSLSGLTPPFAPLCPPPHRRAKGGVIPSCSCSSSSSPTPPPPPPPPSPPPPPPHPPLQCIAPHLCKPACRTRSGERSSSSARHLYSYTQANSFPMFILRLDIIFRTKSRTLGPSAASLGA